jgi:hypothetical protein
MTDFQKFNASTHPLLYLEDEWNNLLDHGLEKTYDYIIRINGSYYEAINGTTGQIDFGGAGNAGGINGSNALAVIAATVASGYIGGVYNFVRILIKKGIYPISGVIPWYSNVEINGEGRSTILNLTTNSNLLSTNGMTSHSLHFGNLVLKNIQLEGNNHTGDAIHLEYVSDTLMENVYIENFVGCALYLKEGWVGHYKFLKIDNCGSVASSMGAIHLISSSSDVTCDLVFINIVCAGYAFAGLVVGTLTDYGVNVNRFQNCIFEGSVGNSYPAIKCFGNFNMFIGCDCAWVANNQMVVVLDGDQNSFTYGAIRGNSSNNSILGVTSTLWGINRAIITGNMFCYGTLTCDTGAHTTAKVYGNVGFITENSGQYQFTNNQWYNHGLSGSPQLGTVLITSRENALIFVLQANSTQFQVGTSDGSAHWGDWYACFKP